MHLKSFRKYGLFSFLSVQLILIYFLASCPGGVLLGILGGGVPPGSQILTLFQTKKSDFPHPFSDQNLACSRLGDNGEKSFSKKKCEKRAGAGERTPFPKSRASYFRFAHFNTSALYYPRAWHRLIRTLKSIPVTFSDLAFRQNLCYHYLH